MTKDRLGLVLAVASATVMAVTALLGYLTMRHSAPRQLPPFWFMPLTALAVVMVLGMCYWMTTDLLVEMPQRKLRPSIGWLVGFWACWPLVWVYYFTVYRRRASQAQENEAEQPGSG